MGWYDDMIGDLTDTYSGGGYSSNDDFDWWGAIGGNSDSGDGGWLSTLGGWASKFFGGGSGGSGGGGGGNIYEGILAGLGGAADALISKEAVEEQGKQQRKTLDFKAALEDYYNQRNKVRKRAALDTYGQFSTMSRWAPTAQAAPPIDQPAKPGY